MTTPNKLQYWHFPTTICFGEGAALMLKHYCTQLSLKRPFLTVDPFLLTHESIQPILQQLEQCFDQITLYSNVASNPNSDHVKQGLSLYQENQCDSVICLGGGSAIDLGKAIALLLNQKRPLADFEDIGDNYKRVLGTIPAIIAIPTTAGTGSEVGRATVIHDLTDNRKVILFHPDLLPKVVLADPLLTLSLPPQLTAATGMDALSHCLESYFVDSYHPSADGIALEGIQLITHWLPIAYQHGERIDARRQMLAGAQCGAIAFQKGLGAMHALSHAIGALYQAHHGLINAILMPYVMQFNQTAIEHKIQKIQTLCGMNDLIDTIKMLQQQLDIPSSLTAIGITKVEEAIVALAVRDPSCQGNPIPLNKQNLAQILELAI